MLVLGVFIPIVQATKGAANTVRNRVMVDVYMKSNATAADNARVMKELRAPWINWHGPQAGINAAQVDSDAGKGYRTLGVARTGESGKWTFLGLLPTTALVYFQIA